MMGDTEGSGEWAAGQAPFGGQDALCTRHPLLKQQGPAFPGQHLKSDPSFLLGVGGRGRAANKSASN